MKTIHVILVVAIACLVGTGAAVAAEAAVPATLVRQSSLAQVFTFLFLMLGPFKIIGPFAQLTKGDDANLTRQIALQARVEEPGAQPLEPACVLGGVLAVDLGCTLPELRLRAQRGDIDIGAGAFLLALVVESVHDVTNVLVFVMDAAVQ